jgi:hypothetical protein
MEDLISSSNHNQKHLFKIKCEETKDEFRMFGRPCELSAFSFVPENHVYETPERTIYNYKQTSKNEGNSTKITDYDRLFNIEYDFNNKVHRDDRRHAKLKGLNVWNEEVQKVVPSKHSSDIGKLIVNLQSKDPIKFNYEIKLDESDRRHVRIDKKAEFYNRNGINDLNRQRGIL